MEIFKILAICIITAVLAIVLKQQKGEYALAVALAGGTVVIVYILNGILAPIEYIESKLSNSGVKTEYFTVALKALGIGYITGFIADICRDSGQVSLASKAELAGKCAIFILSVPLISAVLDTALGFLS
ncbi:MAG: SpoIIIAC/SpoIIIAD family protein [Acutalibacteraceae bacterium]|nr:SpoIIIAC/SpoIIIAD family protein [Acutalibacteraceae bacterium]